MARILIGGFPDAQALSLANELRIQRHVVELYCLSVDQFERYSAEADVVILDLSRDDPSTKKLLEQASRLRMKTGLRPMLLAVLRAYRGPRFEAEVERKGVRVVYVS